MHLRRFRIRRSAVAVAGIAALAMASAACSSSASGVSSSGGGDIVLGTLQPLSGAFASLGQQTDWGVQYAVDQVNADGGILGGRKIKLVTADATTDNESSATAAASKLLESHPSAIIGPTDSTVLLPASTATERAHVPMCTQSFDDIITGRGYKYIFQVLPKASTISSFTVPVIKQLAPLLGVDTKRIALLYDNTAGTVSLFAGLKKSLTADGLTPVYDQQYQVGINNATSIAAAIKSSGADLLVQGSSSPQDVALIARALSDQHVTIPVLNPSGGSANPTYIESAGPGVNGSFIIAEWTATMNLGQSQNQLLSQFNSKMSTEHKLPFAGNFTGMGYVCAENMIAAIKKAGSTDPTKVRDALVGSTFSSGGASLMPPGHVTYAQTGLNSAATLVVGQWCHGKIDTVLPANLASNKPQSPASCR
jgi:branched-chain amino acid transport system substrate-binding protein